DLPAGLAVLVAGGEAGGELPRAALRADGVPLDLRCAHPAAGQAVEDEVAQRRGVLTSADGEAAGLVDHPAALGEDGALVALDVLHGQAGGLRDLHGRGPGADARLDLLGPQPCTGADLLELGPVAPDGSPQRVVD